MRGKILFFFTVCVFAAVLAFGIITKQTYTDLVKQENYLEKLQVAEFPESLSEKACAAMRQGLPDAAVILRVEVTGGIEHLFYVDRQKAVIKEIYAGSGLEQGEEVYVFSRHWSLFLGNGEDAIERGFVNIMETGTEYLVFAEDVVSNEETDILSVRLCDDFLIAPVFCYREHQNVVVPVSGELTYVPYKDVADNEFFGTSEETLRMLGEVKSLMLSLYPDRETY